jgi:quinol monooxygenase YgiN
MPKISKNTSVQTVLTTFEVTPGTCEDLLDALNDAYENVISKQKGFVAAGLHVNDAQTRIANYSQWERREDFQAMLRTEEMRRRNRKISDMCKSFEPVMY